MHLCGTVNKRMKTKCSDGTVSLGQTIVLISFKNDPFIEMCWPLDVSVDQWALNDAPDQKWIICLSFI